MSKKMNKSIDKIIDGFKKANPRSKTPLTDALTRALVHPTFRTRDMRQEAMDMGSHGAKEMFGGQDGRTV